MARLFSFVLYGAIAGVAFYFAQPQFEILAGPPSEKFHVIKEEEAVTLVKLLGRYKQVFDPAEYQAYMNHCLRVLTYAEYYMEMTDEQREIAEAALAYHDIALWSDGKLNYLEPSADRALSDLSDNRDLIKDIIMAHHKVTEFKGSEDDELVNAVRMADWLDFTSQLGLPARSGMPAGNIYKALSEIPTLGFIKVLAGFPNKIMPSNPIRGNIEVMKIYKW